MLNVSVPREAPRTLFNGTDFFSFPTDRHFATPLDGRHSNAALQESTRFLLPATDMSFGGKTTARSSPVMGFRCGAIHIRMRVR